jgi:hypothetical protein
MTEPHLVAERQFSLTQFHTPAEALRNGKPILVQLSCELKGDSVEL